MFPIASFANSGEILGGAPPSGGGSNARDGCRTPPSPRVPRRAWSPTLPIASRANCGETWGGGPLGGSGSAGAGSNARGVVHLPPRTVPLVSAGPGSSVAGFGNNLLDWGGVVTAFRTLSAFTGSNGVARGRKAFGP